MDPANGREALAEIRADVGEGADMIMVKPALPALDLVALARAHTDLPVAAYQVSGEYAAICAAAERGWLDRRAAALESLTAISRAGAGILVTYFALEAACWLREVDR
jgi:porphobilinogen synthase